MALQREQLNDLFKTNVGRTATDYEVSQYSNLSFPQLQKTISSYKTLQPNNSVVDFLKHSGQDSSISSRGALANQYGIADYQGTAEQNLELLNNLRKGPPVSRVETQAQTVSDMAKNVDIQNIPNPNVLTLDDKARAILKYGAGTDAQLGQMGLKGMGMSGVIPNGIPGSIDGAAKPQEVANEVQKQGIPEPKTDIPSPYTPPTDKQPVTQTQNFLNKKTTKDGYTFSQLAQALGRQESNNNYKAENKDSGALGKYQIMPKYWFSKIGLNPNSDADKAQFLNSPDLQEKLHGMILQDLNNLYKGNTRQVIAHYYGGPNAAKIYGTNAGNADQTGALTGTKYPTINKYVEQVMSRLGDMPVVDETAQTETIDPETGEVTKTTEQVDAGDISGVGDTPPTKTEEDKVVEDNIKKAKDDYVAIQSEIRRIDKLLKQSYDEKKAQIERTGGIVNQAQLEGLVRNQNAPLVAERNELADKQAIAGAALKTAQEEREYQRALKKDALDAKREDRRATIDDIKLKMDLDKFQYDKGVRDKKQANKERVENLDATPINELFKTIRPTKNSATVDILDEAFFSAKSDKQKMNILIGQADIPAPIKTDLISRNAAKKNLEKALKTLNEGVQTGLIEGNAERFVNKLGQTNDPKLVELKQRITSSIQPYRSAVTGAAWGPQEQNEYDSLFGAITDNPALLRTKLENMINIMDDTTVSDISSSLSLNDPDSVAPLLSSPSSTTSGGGSDTSYEAYLKAVNGN